MSGQASHGDPEPTPAPASASVPADVQRRTTPEEDATRAAAHEFNAQMMRALGRAVGNFTPWIIEFGSWIFAGLIAFTLIVLGPLINVGPVAPSILVATVAFALALPVNLAGLFILRLVQDLQRIGFADEVARSLREAGLPSDDTGATVPTRAANRVNLVLLYTLVILLVSALLTLTGMVAALWHMAWWIAVAFLVMLALSVAAVIIALVTIRPPNTPAQRERYQHYWDALLARARAEQARKSRDGA